MRNWGVTLHMEDLKWEMNNIFTSSTAFVLPESWEKSSKEFILNDRLYSEKLNYLNISLKVDDPLKLYTFKCKRLAKSTTV